MKRLVLLTSLAVCLLVFIPRAGYSAVSVTISLDVVTNYPGVTYAYASAEVKSALSYGARWGVVGWEPITNISGGVFANNGVYVDEGIYVIAPSLHTNYYTPIQPEHNIQTATNIIYYYIPYSNTLSVVVYGPATPVAWTLSGPSEFANASAYQTTHTDSVDLVAVPTGSYAVTFPAVRGYTKPTVTSTNITGASPLTNTIAGTYLPYSNSLSVTIYGYPAGNCAWSITGPAAFTNATGYASGYTNNATISAVPTGTYTFAFPGVIGYTTPTNTTEITAASAAAISVTGTYVLAYPTNIPAGTGIQKFYQPSYFFTNVYLHDSGIPVHTRLTDNVGATGAAATISVAWTSNGLAGTAVVVTNVGDSNNAEFGFIIPIGDTGATGTAGAAASIAVAWTSNGIAGSDAIVTNVGTTNAAEFGFIIPAADEALWIAASNNVVYTNTAAYTAAVAQAAAAYPASNPSNFITEVGTVSHTNLTDANGAADVQHLTAAEKAHAAAAITNETDPVWESEKSGYATGTPLYVYSETDPVWESEKSGYATGTPLYVESYIGTIVGLTGQTGAVFSVTTNNGVLDLTVPSGGEGGAGNITNLLSADGSVVITSPAGPQPDLSATQYVQTELADYLPTNDTEYVALLTNTLAFHAESNIYQRVDGTNVYYGESVTVVAGTTAGTYYDGANGASVSGQVAVLTTNKASVESYKATSNIVDELNTNAVRLTDAAYTNTAALAAAALPKAGGVMSGNIGMGGKAITNIDYIVTTNYVWVPVNGTVYFGTTTNYIIDQNGTNFGFKIGTNDLINFGI